MKLLKSVLYATSAMVFCGAEQALSQTAGSGDEQLQEVVVTARRVTENLQDVPISITVFNQRELTDKNITSAADLAAYTPSLGVNLGFGPDNAGFSLRGFSQASGTAPTVAVYFADVVAPRGGVGGNAEQAGDGAGPGSFFDLQNVQVVKGPQGTLFGRNTTGGALLLVPQKPTSEFGGYIEAGGGNHDMERTQAVVNLPINDRVRLRLGFDQETRAGYLDNVSGIGPRDFSNINYIAARASLVVDVTRNIENYTIASYSQSDAHGQEQQLFGCNPNLAIFGQLSCNQVAQFNGNPGYQVENDLSDPFSYLRKWQVINTTTWNASDNLTVKNIASYAQTASNLQSNLFGTDFIIPSTFDLTVPGLGVFHLPTGAAAGQHLLFTASALPPGLYLSYQDQYTEELQFQGRGFNNRLTWQAGFYTEGSNSLQPQGAQSPLFVNCTSIVALQCTDLLKSILGTSIGFVQRQVGTIDFRDYAGYGQATYAIFDRLKFTGGVRYTNDRTTGEVTRELWTFPAPNQPVHACLAGVQDPATCHTSLETSSSSPTWLLDLEYTPIDGLLTYAKYARGYRTGGIVIAAPPGYLTFQPEHIDDYELGEKFTFGGPIPGYVDLVAFYNSLTNQQVPIGFIAPPGTQGAPSGSIGNLGKSRVYGFEWGSAFRLYEGLTWNLSYTYLNTRIQEVTQPTTVAGSPFVPTTSQVAGAPFNGVPNHKLSTTASYRLPFDMSIGNISVATTYTFQGRSSTGLPGSFSEAPSISLLNLNLNWESVVGSRFDAEFFVTNLTDHYYAIATSDFSTSLGFVTRVLGEPRMFGGRLRYHFGRK